MSEDCAFCAIAAGRLNAERVAENEAALAFLDRNPAADGHTLIIPKSHKEDIWALSPEDGQPIWALTWEIAARLREVLRPDGLTLFQANRTAGWQHVFHFHLHVVPRWAGDGLVMPWTEALADASKLPELGRRIRAGLR